MHLLSYVTRAEGLGKYLYAWANHEPPLIVCFISICIFHYVYVLVENQIHPPHIYIYIYIYITVKF